MGRSRKGEWGFDASGLLTLASGLEIYFVYTESNVCWLVLPGTLQTQESRGRTGSGGFLGRCRSQVMRATSLSLLLNRAGLPRQSTLLR